MELHLVAEENAEGVKMADQVDRPAEGGNRYSGPERRESDGEILRTAQSATAGLTFAQRWGGMIGTLILVGSYGGMNFAQYQAMRDDVHELKEARKLDDKEKSDLKIRLQSAESYIEHNKVDMLYLDQLRIEREARKLVDQQKKQAKGE